MKGKLSDFQQPVPRLPFEARKGIEQQQHETGRERRMNWQKDKMQLRSVCHTNARSQCVRNRSSGRHPDVVGTLDTPLSIKDADLAAPSIRARHEAVSQLTQVPYAIPVRLAMYDKSRF